MCSIPIDINELSELFHGTVNNESNVCTCDTGNLHSLRQCLFVISFKILYSLNTQFKITIINPKTIKTSQVFVK